MSSVVSTVGVVVGIDLVDGTPVAFETAGAFEMFALLGEGCELVTNPQRVASVVAVSCQKSIVAKRTCEGVERPFCRFGKTLVDHVGCSDETLIEIVYKEQWNNHQKYFGFLENEFNEVGYFYFFLHGVIITQSDKNFYIFYLFID